MFETRVTELFGIKYPIVGGALNVISRAEFVAAISNAGALGIMVSVMYPTLEEFRQEVRKCRALTDKPFAVNITFGTGHRAVQAEDLIRVSVEEGAPIIETAARSPEPYVSLLKQPGIKWMHKCARVKDAVKVEQLGADAVSIVGFECGGHPGLDDITSLVLAPMTADAVKIPVIAGGGFVDGRGLVAALALGADAVLMGTRFMITQESMLHPNVKEFLLKADETSTTIIQRTMRNNSRVMKNATSARCLELEGRGAPVEEILPVISGERNRLVINQGEIDAGTLACGEVVGMIRDVPTVQELVDRIMKEAVEVRSKIAG